MDATQRGEWIELCREFLLDYWIRNDKDAQKVRSLGPHGVLNLITPDTAAMLWLEVRHSKPPLPWDY